MGNQVCCLEVEEAELPQPKHIELHSYQYPALLKPVKKHLEQFKPFESKFTTTLQIVKFRHSFYQGSLNGEGKPQGYAKLYFQNGCVFVGQFENGIANGDGHYVFSDGSFYHGKMEKSKAHTDDGYLQTFLLTYKGGFKNNNFWGKGKQQTKSYTFEGQYYNGKKIFGILKWNEQYLDEQGITSTLPLTYEGYFDQKQKFTQGELYTLKGKYSGQFLNGKKHGKGVFEYQNKLKYDGDYENDERHGFGTLLKKDGSVYYSGEWRRGLPNGKGFTYDREGHQLHLKFIDGIDENIIRD